MLTSGSGVSLPPLQVPAMVPPRPQAPTLPTREFLPPLPRQQRPLPKGQGTDKDSNCPSVMAGQGVTLLMGAELVTPWGTPTHGRCTSRDPPGLQEPPGPDRDPQEKVRATRRLQNLPEVHSLCLQQNHITKIENLGCFPNLRFLSLAGNRIRRVENLQPLRHLQALDLSHNRIQELDTAEMLHSLHLLDLTGNECTQQCGYRELVLDALPHLRQLDTQIVRSSRGKEEEEGGSSSSDDEDDELLPEPSDPFTADRDFFADLQRDLSRHSRQRQKEALEEHWTRLEEPEELWQHQALLSTACAVAPRLGKGK